jgi:hypothetical protein
MHDDSSGFEQALERRWCVSHCDEGKPGTVSMNSEEEKE